ncbi:APH(3'') family aminoglycoside O-phosphotransferase [Streptomyces zhihengii]|uniref:APH(3'') family aminoglycoside O-phosphotransferase n=1 Tax=Streptomyces zhihengii TaxID=1818004 RepID=A0ABS2V300_9ACTN|nr:APH(3'') family aminoglycoside O-phosphotransferase [Streptomyces zhihengii]MBM9623547.1 APH(3'') family aminoglycoside O-phosphotransferase [Streptomyces zhihengii]
MPSSPPPEPQDERPAQPRTAPDAPREAPPAPPGADGDWLPVGGGESGAAVFRGADATRYAKCVPAADTEALRAERDRITWLSGQGVPGPRVLDWYSGDAGACLVSSAVPGTGADRLPPEALRAAWGSVTDAVRRLHRLPAAECPYDRGLDIMVAAARDVVARGAVDPAFLPDEQQHTPAGLLLERVLAQVPRRRAQEPADTVVCHGDLCLPNILVDPHTLEVTGFIDLGRLGRADRHADVALLLANARETWADEEQAEAADAAFAEGYGMVPDPGRLRFYLDLDPLTWG